MTLSTKRFWIVSILVLFCCVLFALPDLLRAYRETWPRATRSAPFNLPLPFGGNVSDWGDKSLRIEWKLAISRGKQTSQFALDEEIPVIYIAAILENRSDKSLSVSSLTFLLQSDGVNVLSVPFGFKTNTSFPVTIPPNQKVTLQADSIVSSSVMLGLLERSLDLNAACAFEREVTPNLLDTR